MVRDGALARFYPTVADDPADPGREDPVFAFRQFCLDRAGAVRERLRTRRTQTNAVRRSAALYPAFGAVARLPDPLVVLDTQVLYQLDDATRERFRGALVELGRDRELHWLAGERPP